MLKFIKRVITLCGRKTSIQLTEYEWQILENICRCENIRRNKLLDLIKNNKSTKTGLTYAVRLFMLIYINKSASPLLYRQDAKNISLNGILSLLR